MQNVLGPRGSQKRGAFEKSLSKLWFDTHVHDERVLDFVFNVMGKDRLVMNKFLGWDQHTLELILSIRSYSDNAKVY